MLRAEDGRGQEVGAGRPARRFACLPDRQAADAEVRDSERRLAVRPQLHQDVGRLEVAVDDGRIQPVSEADDRSEALDDRAAWIGVISPLGAVSWISPVRSPPATYS